MILHCIMVYLSCSTTIHIHDVWYLARVIDGNFTDTHLEHNWSARVGVHMHVKLVLGYNR